MAEPEPVCEAFARPQVIHVLTYVFVNWLGSRERPYFLYPHQLGLGYSPPRVHPNAFRLPLPSISRSGELTHRKMIFILL